MTDLPGTGRAELVSALLPELLTPLSRKEADHGATVKTLWRLFDGALVESVLMRYPGRVTMCVSSQAGCGMNCPFCATGQAGLTRNLSTAEIVEQVAAAGRALRSGRVPGGRPGAADRVGNVVFMGMGEPLANEPAVWAAIERLHRDLGMAARHLTVSTVGIVPGIRTLSARPLPVNLAVSLHAANDALRDELVPINKRYPLDVLMGACADYLRAKGRRLSFEWALIADTNDRPSDAAELAARCRSLPLAAHVNLIPLNPTPGWPTVGTGPAGVRTFRDRLIELGVNATVRQNRGTEIDAACGQLAAGQPVTLGRRRAG
jgi:23S rRNA (adenine2503-C2)-methyltransferase